MVPFLPTLLSFLVLAAHFLRAGNLLLVLGALAAPVLLLIRRRVALRGVQFLLFLAALVWLGTIPGSMANARHPPVAAAILGTVAALALVSAVLLNHPRLLRLYPR